MRTDSPPWLALLALVVALFAVAFLAGPLLQLGVDPALAGLLVVALAVVALLVRRRTGPRDSDASVWDAIPSWQYEGRHVESGGLTRDEQERALHEVQVEAERRERE